MKTYLKFLFLWICITLLPACSETLQRDYDLQDMELTSRTVDAGLVFVVYPNGIDDTEALRQAFDNAISAGPGAVVQLVEGEYHLRFLEICGFNGTFKGAGKGKTVITALTNLDVDALISLNLNTVLVRFVRGIVFMSDMTVKTPPGPLSDGSESRIDALVGFSAKTFQNTSGDNYIKAVINNVDFKGHWDNCGYGLKAEFGCRSGAKVTGGYPLSKTDIKITNCAFRDFLYSGALIWHINGGTIIVGTHGDGNIFDNNKGEHTSSSVGYGSLGIWMNINVEISVVDNLFNNPSGTWYGIDLWRAPYPLFLQQVPQTKVTFCNIEKNVFNSEGGSGGIKMNDRWRYFYPADQPMLVQVKNNRFNMSNVFSGIECLCMSGLVLRNNIFTGGSSYGVYISTDGFFNAVKANYNENGLMLGNNLSNGEYSVASVYLNSNSKNWTIVGGNLGETIINEGENNLITGMYVSSSGVPFGQTIVDNFDDPNN